MHAWEDIFECTRSTSHPLAHTHIHTLTSPPILLRTHTRTHTHFTLHPNAAQMQTWVDDYFYKAIDEVLSMEPIVETTMVGTVMCGLSQCGEAKSKGEFVMGIIKGLGGNLNIEQRCSFAKKVC